MLRQMRYYHVQSSRFKRFAIQQYICPSPRRNRTDCYRPGFSSFMDRFCVCPWIDALYQVRSPKIMTFHLVCCVNRFHNYQHRSTSLALLLRFFSYQITQIFLFVVNFQYHVSVNFKVRWNIKSGQFIQFPVKINIPIIPSRSCYAYYVLIGIKVNH